VRFGEGGLGSGKRENWGGAREGMEGRCAPPPQTKIYHYTPDFHADIKMLLRCYQIFVVF